MKKTLTRLAGAATLAAALAAAAPAATAAGTVGQTKYPIVLVHGLLGYDNIGTSEYWYQIPAALRGDGATVFVSQVSAVNSTEVRGEQLLTYVKQVLAQTGAKKVNLIGHSHGGPTTRYVASVAPSLVASVTSVGGVNKGSLVADVTVGGSASSAVYNAIGAMIGLLSGNPGLPQNANGAQRSLSTAGSLKFNQSHPQGVPTTACGEGAYSVNGVAYYSWTGAQAYTNAADVAIDPYLATTSTLFGTQANDGLVSTCSAHLGKVISDSYRINHFDEVNQTVGLVNVLETNPVTIYRQHATRLKNAGL